MAAARRPFRLTDPAPAPKGTAARPLPAKGENTVLKPEQPIPPSSSRTEEALGHGHSPRIPWPADKAVDHKPMKFRGD